MKGIRVVDAALSGGPIDIIAGRLTLFIGATDEDLEAVRPLFRTYAEVIVHAGQVGYGQRVKLINNALFTAHMGLAADALRLGHEIGVPEAVLLASLPHASGNSRAVQIIAASGSLEQSTAAVGRFVAKDVRVVQNVAARMRADLGVLGQVIKSPYIQDEIMKY
jgi:3-hydroxyisobutyrate dehydrogenase-like beta-hydroxyacid dehydrogenase